MNSPRRVILKSQMQILKENREKRQNLLRQLEKERNLKENLGRIYNRVFNIKTNEDGWEARSQDCRHHFCYIEQDQDFFLPYISGLKMVLRDQSVKPGSHWFLFTVALANGEEYQLNAIIDQSRVTFSCGYYRLPYQYSFQDDYRHHPKMDELKIIAQKIEDALREYPALRLKLITSSKQIYYQF